MTHRNKTQSTNGRATGEQVSNQKESQATSQSLNDDDGSVSRLVTRAGIVLLIAAFGAIVVYVVQNGVPLH